MNAVVQKPGLNLKYLKNLNISKADPVVLHGICKQWTLRDQFLCQPCSAFEKCVSWNISCFKKCYLRRENILFVFSFNKTCYFQAVTSFFISQFYTPSIICIFVYHCILNWDIKTTTYSLGYHPANLYRYPN